MKFYKENGASVVTGGTAGDYIGGVIANVSDTRLTLTTPDGRKNIADGAFADFTTKLGASIGTTKEDVLAYCTLNAVFKSAVTAESVAEVESASNNLIFDVGAVIVNGATPAHNSATALTEGTSIEIPISDANQYFVVREGIPNTGSPTVEQYKVMATYFKNAGGTVLAPNGADIFNFAYTTKSKLITPPAGAVKMILVLKTKETDMTGRLSVQVKTASNFCLSIEPKMVVAKSIVEIFPSIINDKTIIGTGISNSIGRCRTEVISVKENSVIQIQLGATATQFGGLVTMYDSNMVQVGTIQAANGVVSGSFMLIEPIRVGSLIYLSLDTNKFAFLTIGSHSATASYVVPRIYAEVKEQVLEPKVGVLRMTNMIDTADANLRNKFDFVGLTSEGLKFRFRVAPVSLAYGIGFGLYDSRMVDRPAELMIGSKPISDLAIADYFSFRCKVGGVQDAGFTGHGNTVVMTTLNIYNEYGLIYNNSTGISPAGKFINEGKFFRFVQTGILKYNFTPQQDLATYRLTWVIYPDGRIESDIQYNATQAFEVTNNYPIMGVLRNDFPTTAIKWDGLQFTGGAFQAVTATGTRQYLIKNAKPYTGTIFDSVNNVKLEFDYDESTTQTGMNVSGKSLSFESETNFCKTYVIGAIGNFTSGKQMNSRSTLKFSKITP